MGGESATMGCGESRLFPGMLPGERGENVVATGTWMIVKRAGGQGEHSRRPGSGPWQE